MTSELSCPFPGMDPFIESSGLWPDFHATFITYWREAICDILPDNYEARIGERVNLMERDPGQVKRIEPDVAVSKQPASKPKSNPASNIATLEPVTIPLIIEEETRETYIEIINRPARELIAVLELFSPSNKAEPRKALYLAKRNALLQRNVHLVELDLLLTGQRISLRDVLPPGDFYTMISRADRRPDCNVYTWKVQEPLPTLPVPLKAPDPDININIGIVFETTYERGRYISSIDYTTAEHSGLSNESLKWFREQANNDPFDTGFN